MERLLKDLQTAAEDDDQLLRVCKESLPKESLPEVHGKPDEYLCAWLDQHEPEPWERWKEERATGEPRDETLKELVKTAFGLGFIRHNPAAHQSYCHWLLCGAIKEELRANLMYSMTMPTGTGTNGALEEYLKRSKLKVAVLRDAFLDPRGRVATEDAIAGMRSVAATLVRGEMSERNRVLGVLFCFFPVPKAFDPPDGSQAEGEGMGSPLSVRCFESLAKEYAKDLENALDKEALEEALHAAQREADRVVSPISESEGSRPEAGSLLETLIPRKEAPDNPVGFQLAMFTQADEKRNATAAAQDPFLVRLHQLVQVGCAFPGSWADARVSFLDSELTGGIKGDSAHDAEPSSFDEGGPGGPIVVPLIVDLQKRALDVLGRPSDKPWGEILRLQFPRAQPSGAAAQVGALCVDLEPPEGMAASRRPIEGDLASVCEAAVVFLVSLQERLDAASSCAALKGLLDLRRNVCGLLGSELRTRLARGEGDREEEQDGSAAFSGEAAKLVLAATPDLETKDRSSLYGQIQRIMSELKALPRQTQPEGSKLVSVSVWSSASRFVISSLNADKTSNVTADRLFLADNGLLDTIYLLVEFWARQAIRRNMTLEWATELNCYIHDVSKYDLSPSWLVVSPAVSPLSDRGWLRLTLSVKSPERSGISDTERLNATEVTTLLEAEKERESWQRLFELTWKRARAPELLALKSPSGGFRARLFPSSMQQCLSGVHDKVRRLHHHWKKGEKDLNVSIPDFLNLPLPVSQTAEDAWEKFRDSLSGDLCEQSDHCDKKQERLCGRLASYLAAFARPRFDTARGGDPYPESHGVPESKVGPEVTLRFIAEGLPAQNSDEPPPPATLLTCALAREPAIGGVRLRQLARNRFAAGVKLAALRSHEIHSSERAQRAALSSALSHEGLGVAVLIERWADQLREAAGAGRNHDAPHWFLTAGLDYFVLWTDPAGDGFRAGRYPGAWGDNGQGLPCSSWISHLILFSWRVFLITQGFSREIEPICAALKTRSEHIAATLRRLEQGANRLVETNTLANRDFSDAGDEAMWARDELSEKSSPLFRNMVAALQNAFKHTWQEYLGRHPLRDGDLLEAALCALDRWQMSEEIPITVRLEVGANPVLSRICFANRFEGSWSDKSKGTGDVLDLTAWELGGSRIWGPCDGWFQAGVELPRIRLFKTKPPPRTWKGVEK